MPLRDNEFLPQRGAGGGAVEIDGPQARGTPVGFDMGDQVGVGGVGEGAGEAFVDATLNWPNVNIIVFFL